MNLSANSTRGRQTKLEDFKCRRIKQYFTVKLKNSIKVNFFYDFLFNIKHLKEGQHLVGAKKNYILKIC